MKNLKKSLCLLLSVIMAFSLLTIIPLRADALSNVKYIDENGEMQTADDVTELTADTGAILHDGWYAVKSDLELSDRINAAGDIHLILCDGATLTAHKGITVAKTYSITNKLTIYAQSKDADEMGALVIDSPDQNQPGIGNTSVAYGHGLITVNGGKLTVTGGEQGAGIGGGANVRSEGITVNGGIINATGGSVVNGDTLSNGGAGIGGGYGAGCDVVINGGSVRATGGAGAAGIGGGYLNDSHPSVTINGGTINASGTTGGAGIGSGRISSAFSYELDSDCIGKITGGDVTATGGVTGAGIGGGGYSKGSVEITGGTVKAHKGANASSSGIGNGVGTTGSTISLSWTDAEKDNYFADNYSGTVTLQKYFTNRDDEIYTPGKITENSMIDGKTIYPCLLAAKKVWEIDSAKTLRPYSVKIALQVYKSPDGNSEKQWITQQTVSLKEDNNWTVDFDDLTTPGTNSKSMLARVRELDEDDKPIEGESVNFTVHNGGKTYKLAYKVTQSVDQQGRLTFTNKLELRKFKIEKKWDIDLEGKDRPENVQMIIQSKNGDKWSEEQIVTLDEDNEWKTEVDYPKYVIEDGDRKEIEYRIRELREESFYNQFMSGIRDLVLGGKETYDEWTDKLRTEANDIYNMLPDDIRSALDDSYESLCSALGVADDKVNELYDKLMEVLEQESSGNRIVHDKEDDDKGEKEETNRVTYNVSSYNSVVSGGEVSNHATTYKVKYETDGDSITVTNQAIQIINMYKHWIKLNVDDEDMPDSAWLVLMVKPSSGAVDNAQSIASAAGVDLGGILDYDFPVIAPLEGGMGPFEILGEAILDIDLGWLDDLFDLPHVGIVKVDEDCKWRSTIVNTKYTCGIPKEYRGAELSGEIIHQIIKYLTDGAVDLPISYNPFSNYITISTKAIPQLRWMSVDDLKNDLSWDKLIELGKTVSQQDLDNFKPQDLIFDKAKLMTNIINIKFDFDVDDDDDDDDDDNTLKGSKIWAGDDESKRPDWIKIHIKDGGEEIAGSPVTLSKSDFSGQFVWSWSLELEEGVSKSSLTVSEEYPSDYANKDSYASTILGTTIVNKWSTDSTNINGKKIWKDNDNAQEKRPDQITVNLLADGEKVDSKTVTAANGWTYVFADKPTYKTDGGNKVKIEYTVTEEEVENYTATYDGYNIINTLDIPDTPEFGKLKITATRPASAKDKEQSFVYTVTGDSVDLTVAIVLGEGETSGSVTVAQLPTGDYEVTEESEWSWRYSPGGSETAAVTADETAEAAFDHTLISNIWLNGYSHRDNG